MEFFFSFTIGTDTQTLLFDKIVILQLDCSSNINAKKILIIFVMAFGRVVSIFDIQKKFLKVFE